MKRYLVMFAMVALRAYLMVAPHLLLFPGPTALVVLGLNLLGDSLRDWLDVR